MIGFCRIDYSHKRIPFKMHLGRHPKHTLAAPSFSQQAVAFVLCRLPSGPPRAKSAMIRASYDWKDAEWLAVVNRPKQPTPMTVNNTVLRDQEAMI